MNWKYAGMVCGLLVLLALATIYWKHQSNRVFVEAVIEIGQGGLPKKYRFSPDVDHNRIEMMMLKPLERGEDMMEALDIKYQFDRTQKPRLIRRLRRNQAVTYSQVITLTVEGENKSSALDYMDEIVKGIVERHDRIYQKRMKYAEQYFAESKAMQKEWGTRCATIVDGSQQDGSGLSRGYQEQPCDVTKSVELILLRANIAHLMSPTNTWKSSIALKPTLR